METTNILFFCGGAFGGLSDIILKRLNAKTIGFGADIQSNHADLGSILGRVEPEDLLKYGMIPEFVGRLPVLATLSELDEEAMVEILKEPKNSLIKQYQKLFEMENVALKFTDGAVVAIAREALKRNTGARGLRAIMENAMLDVMYDIPSQKRVKEVIVNEDVIVKNAAPLIVYESVEETA